MVEKGKERRVLVLATLKTAARQVCNYLICVEASPAELGVGVDLVFFKVRRLIERYPLCFGGRYPPGEQCPGACVLRKALTAPRGVLSRVKFFNLFYFGKLIKFVFLFSYLSIFRSVSIISW